MHVKYPESDSSHRKNLELSWSTSKGTGSLIVNEPRTIALLDHETVSHRVHRDERGRAVYIEAVRTTQRRTLLLQREDDFVLTRMAAEKKREIVQKRWTIAGSAALLVAAIVLGINVPVEQLTIHVFDDVRIYLPLWVSAASIMSLLYNVVTPVGPGLRIPAALRSGKEGDSVTAERWIELEESIRGWWGADDMPISEREDMFTRMRAEDRDALFELTRTDPPAFRQLFELLVRQWSSERETIAREKARLAQEHDQRRLQEADAIAEKKFAELGFSAAESSTPQEKNQEHER